MSRYALIRTILGVAGVFGMVASRAAGAQFTDITPTPRIAQSLVPLLVNLPAASAAPVIDGQLDDPCWRTAYKAGSFRLLGSSLPATQQTEVRILRRGDCLYFGITCFEDRMQQVKSTVTAFDGPVWQDDCVEIFVDADHDHRTYCHFLVNPNGTAMDARLTAKGRLDVKWNGTWQHAVTRHKDRWCVEAAIPLTALDGPCAAVIGLNVAREERPHGELSSWMPQEHHFAYTPDEVLRFADVAVQPASVALAALDLAPLCLGANRARGRLRGPETGVPVAGSLRLTLTAPDGTAAARATQVVTVKPAATVPLNLDFALSTLNAGTYTLTADFQPRGGGAAVRLAQYPLPVEQTTPLALLSPILIGSATPARLRVAPMLSSELLRHGAIKLRLSAPGGAAIRQTTSLAPLAPSATGILDLVPRGLPAGRLRLTASLVDGGGHVLHPTLKADLIRLAGPFETEPGATLVANPSFEAGNDSGTMPDWTPAWWAPRSAGLAPVPPAEFAAVQRGGAYSGEHCLRIHSTRNGHVPVNEVLHVRSKSVKLLPGTLYRFTVACRTQSLQGEAKIWLQLPKRQVVLIDGVPNADTWRLVEATFTPAPGETSCQVCLSLDGKGGTVWYDQVQLCPAAPRIADLLVPNACDPQGICRLAALPRENRHLELHFALFGARAPRALTAWTQPVAGDTTAFTLPAGTKRAARLVVRLETPGGGILDACGAGLFLAPPPFPR